MKGNYMFALKPPTEKSGLTKARDEALIEMQGFAADAEEYEKMMVHVKTLTELIDLEKSEKLSPNTIAIIIGNSAVALLIVGYENKNVVTSKVLSFMLKFK